MRGGTATDEGHGKRVGIAMATTHGIATPFGTIQVRIARARGKSFLPKGSLSATGSGAGVMFVDLPQIRTANDDIWPANVFRAIVPVLSMFSFEPIKLMA